MGLSEIFRGSYADFNKMGVSQVLTNTRIL